jgi:hypothetical protein
MIFKLAQCLCPQHHCLLATIALGADEPIGRGLQKEVEQRIRAKKQRPWCALCGAKQEEWRIEVGVMKATTAKEALATLMELAIEQRAAHDYLIATGQAYDSPRRN